MTAKRFNRVGGYVYDGDKCISHFEDVAHRDDIVKLLNELSEENNLLKDIIKDIMVQLDANHTSHTYQMTIPINKVIYNELKRRLTGTSFNEELRRFLE